MSVKIQMILLHLRNMSFTDPMAGSRHPGTFTARGEESALPSRALPEYLRDPSWSLDPTKTSLHR